MEKNIDAENKILGRLASEVATSLRGKDRADFAPNKVPDVKVVVTNLSGLNISPKKAKQKKYVSHSGYPGSLKFEPMDKLIERRGIEEVFKKAVRNMLPKNRLNKRLMKNLILKK